MGGTQRSKSDGSDGRATISRHGARQFLHANVHGTDATSDRCEQGCAQYHSIGEEPSFLTNATFEFLLSLVCREETLEVGYSPPGLSTDFL